MSSLILQKILELNFLYPFYFDLTWFFRAISFKNTMLIKLKKNSDRFIIVPKQPFTWNYMAYTRYIDCWCIKLCYQFKLYSIEYLIRTKCYWQGQRKKKKNTNMAMHKVLLYWASILQTVLLLMHTQSFHHVTGRLWTLMLSKIMKWVNHFKNSLVISFTWITHPMWCNGLR